MTEKFTVGVLTSGGDAPGMNAAIRAVVRTALANNMNVIGVMHGYEGLINGEFRPLGARDVGGILQRGGTFLLTSRSKRFMEPAGQRDAIRKMNEAGMDALIVIGGEGSMNGANALAQKGIKVIGIPGSIDNDIWGTNIAIGTDTAMNTIMDAVDKLRDTASSHQRAFLIETIPVGQDDPLPRVVRAGPRSVRRAPHAGAVGARSPDYPWPLDRPAVRHCAQRG